MICIKITKHLDFFSTINHFTQIASTSKENFGRYTCSVTFQQVNTLITSDVGQFSEICKLTLVVSSLSFYVHACCECAPTNGTVLLPNNYSLADLISELISQRTRFSHLEAPILLGIL